MMGRFLPAYSMVLLSTLLLGCSPYASRVPDEPFKMPEKFSGTAQGQTPAPLSGKWWERFNDKKLNALMEEAFLRSPDVAQAHERLIQAQAAAGAARASKWPQLNINAQAARTRSSGFSAMSAGFSAGALLTGSTFTSYKLSAGASYEVDLWRRLASTTEAARLDALASREDLKSIYISISAELADLYFLAAEERAQIELSEKTIAAFKETLDRVEERYRAGLVPALDIYQSRQNLARARAQLPLFEADLDVTQHGISVLLGRPPEKEITGHAATLKEVPDFSAGLPSRLLLQRPDIRAALLKVRADDMRAGAAIADRLPAFNLLGDYGGASERLSNILDSPNILWNILIEAALPVIDGGRRKAEVVRTKAVLRESLSLYRQTVLTALKEVEDALTRGRSAAERIKMLEERVSASEDALRLALETYLQGLSDYLPVLTEQERFYEAKSELLTARRLLISNRIGLARALGGDWTEEAADGRLSGHISRSE